ncbi:MAG: threonine synthase, partial [Betaproteobacteria bacterium]|nr:threonine synthase [Betaproteobacteria bacterium]
MSRDALFGAENAPSIQRCESCGAEWPFTLTANSCPTCDGLLEVIHPHPTLHGAALLSRFGSRCCTHQGSEASGVWRFRELVMPGEGAVVSHPEGNTPLMHRASIAEYAGVASLMLKHEGRNPTGSFKDRGMTAAVTHAVRTGATAVACASTGNTSASLAAYAAQAGLPALVFMPEGKVALGKIAQALAYGARTLIVKGDFDDCLRLARESSRELGVYLANSINPWRVEGQKTIVFEMLQQLGWQAPDWIVLPAGNLGNTSAFGKALRELHALGLITKMPRVLSVQAMGAAPFAHAFETGFTTHVPVRAATVATAIRIGDPASWDRAVRVIRETNGAVLAVNDDAILDAKAVIDAAGVGCEPASAASVAGVRAARASGLIGANDSVVAVLTGHVLKDPELVV